MSFGCTVADPLCRACLVWFQEEPCTVTGAGGLSIAGGGKGGVLEPQKWWGGGAQWTSMDQESAVMTAPAILLGSKGIGASPDQGGGGFLRRTTAWGVLHNPPLFSEAVGIPETAGVR